MKYVREERLEIGRQIYIGELTRHGAAKKYGIGEDRARDYMRMYRDEHGLPPKNTMRAAAVNAVGRPSSRGIGDYEKMTKQELIRELVEVRIREARLKKGYMVKGVGAERQIIGFVSRNMK